jgi:tRNA (guanine-N7-)-methyltransferase
MESACYFQREAPIVLELACGKGEYTLGLATLMPERNYLGVDVKGNRIWRGAGLAWNKQMANVGFLRTPIEQLPCFFEKDEVSEIWITFPDPYPRKGKARKRLTSPMFLRYYLSFLRPGGIVNLKTDADSLYDYTLEVIAELGLPVVRKVDDVYREAPEDPVLTICTFYEEMHLAEGKTIHYVSFQIDPLRDH